MLKNSSHPHPLIFLRGIRFKDLKVIITNSITATYEAEQRTSLRGNGGVYFTELNVRFFCQVVAVLQLYPTDLFQYIKYFFIKINYKLIISISIIHKY